MRRKSKVLTAVLVSAACILAAGGIVCAARNRREGTYIAEINGIEVPEEEFRLFCAENRLDVMNDFKEKYQADIGSSEFWEKEYEGESPAAVLKDRALEQLTRVKVEQAAAVEAGMVKDASYGYIMQLMEEENEKRRDAYENGQIVMGKLDYEEKEFYFYVTGLMRSSLKAELQDEFGITDSEVKALYEENKDQFYLGREKHLQVLSSEAADQDILQLIKEGMDDHKSAAEIAGKFTDAQKEKVLLEERNVLPYTEGKGEDMDALTQAAEALSAGETMLVYMDGTSFRIVTCLEEGGSHYLQEEYAFHVLRTELTGQRYEAYIDEMLKQVQVRVNKVALQKCNVN